MGYYLGSYDLVIVGGGILGVACAWRLKRSYPNKRILLLEKEGQSAQHQTGRNSGVVHAGVYYPPDSLKARYCIEGLERTLAFCRQHHIAHEQCGKLIVATDEQEEKRANALYQRCQQNQLAPVWLDEVQLRQKEPNVQGKSAIWVKKTAITDYVAITNALFAEFENRGGEAIFCQPLRNIKRHSEGLVLTTAKRQFNTRLLLNCAGLHSDRIAKMAGLEIDIRIVPFKGEYFRLPPRLNNIVKHLIYPVPDPALPFLGVHLTRMIDGSVTLGPNAVLSLAREGYEGHQLNVKDTLDTLSYAGFWRLLAKYPKQSFQEWKNSYSKQGYLRRVQKYCPGVQLTDMLPHRCGIRAQAVGKRGELIQDFNFLQADNSLHLLNAPSPAATSAFPIADAVLEKIRAMMS